MGDRNLTNLAEILLYNNSVVMFGAGHQGFLTVLEASIVIGLKTLNVTKNFVDVTNYVIQQCEACAPENAGVTGLSPENFKLMMQKERRGNVV